MKQIAMPILFQGLLGPLGGRFGKISKNHRKSFISAILQFSDVLEKGSLSNRFQIIKNTEKTAPPNKCSQKGRLDKTNTNLVSIV